MTTNRNSMYNANVALMKIGKRVLMNVDKTVSRVEEKSEVENPGRGVQPITLRPSETRLNRGSAISCFSLLFFFFFTNLVLEENKKG